MMRVVSCIILLIATALLGNLIGCRLLLGRLMVPMVGRLIVPRSVVHLTMIAVFPGIAVTLATVVSFPLSPAAATLGVPGGVVVASPLLLRSGRVLLLRSLGF